MPFSLRSVIGVDISPIPIVVFDYSSTTFGDVFHFTIPVRSVDHILSIKSNNHLHYRVDYYYNAIRKPHCVQYLDAKICFLYSSPSKLLLELFFFGKS